MYFYLPIYIWEKLARHLPGVVGVLKDFYNRSPLYTTEKSEVTLILGQPR